MKTFQSTPITFIDQTDSRKLEVYIKSNLPTAQIYNQNTGAYTPDWRDGDGLTLDIDVYLDSRVMADSEYTATLIKWYKDEIAADTEITSNRNKRRLQITDNELDANPIVTYICEATYQEIVASSRITFTRTETGLNGAQGEDGNSILIKGTATSATKVGTTDYYTITYGEGAIVAAELGDSYVYNGDLYVCSVLNGDADKDYFINIGPIQGPAGEPAKSVVLSGSAQVFKVNSEGTTPERITVTATPINLSDANNIIWSYHINNHTDWSVLSNNATNILGGVSRTNNAVTVLGASLESTVESITFKVSYGSLSDVFTIYKAFDGVDGHDGTNGKDGNPGEDAPIAFLTNENVSFVADESGLAYGTTITTNVVAYQGTTKVVPQIGSILAASLPDGMTITIDEEATALAEPEVVLSISVAAGSDLGSPLSVSDTIAIPVTFPVETPLKLSWSKINTGATGVGIKSTTVSYGVSDSASTRPADDAWQPTIPTVADGKYLWTRTIIDYTDESKPDTVTYIYAKQGTKGDTGASGSSVTVSSIQYQEGSSATTAPTGTWSNAVVAVADGRYLWTKTTFSDGKIAYGVAKQGSAGTAASLVDITPSAMYFKSTTGSTGTFTPQYIYLYPRFQNATYSNWQYSLDGGATWKNVISGSDWLLIDTFNSVANALRIERGSKLYTDDITSISFKCNSTTNGVYDTVSIAKIYDVVGLHIGSRNLARFTDSEYWSHYGPATTKISFSEGVRSKRIKVECTITDEASGSFFGVQQMPQARLMKLQPNQEYTLSFLARGNITNLDYTYLMNSGSTNTPIRMTSSPTFSETEFTRVVQTFTTTESATTSTGSYLMISYIGKKDPTMWFELEEIQLEVGNVATDWSPAPEDLIEEASNVNVMLSNESHFFEATAGGVPTETSVTLDVIGYKGSIRSATTVDTIIGKPSAGMTTTVLSNGTTSTKIKIDITSALTSDIADYGALTIPITVNGQVINKIFNWTKAKAGDVGASGSDAVTFQVYSNNGYALSTSVPTLTLQTFAYIGDIEIQAGATYQWYRHNDTDWIAVSGATNSYFNVSRDDVSFSNNYMCKMQFNGTEYVGVVTIDDKNDENKVFASKPSNYFAGDLWIVGTDYAPSGFTVGTMLRAEHTNSTYADSDWVAATKYDEEISDLKDTVDSYKQYFSIDEANGLRVGDASINNNTLTVDRIETTTIEAKEIEVESPLTVTGKYSGSTMQQAPIINIGNFSIVVESNGSLSIVANT